MKILQVMAGAKHGGAETFFVDAMEALSEVDVALSAITRDNNPHKIQTLSDRKIPFETAGFGKFLKFPTSKIIEKELTRFKPDIVQYWMGRAGEYGQRTSAVNVAWYGGYYKPARFKHADVHVGVTKDIADHIIRSGVDAGRVFVLHTYAQFDNAAPVNRTEFDTPEDAPLLLALSRLHSKKGLDIMLKALVSIPDAYLWIAGSGPLEKQLKTLCSELDLDDRVRFLGWRDDRGALLATADVCVFPSRYEPFGTVTVEAWGRGVPLVAAKAAGPKAFITDREDGLLVEIDDIEGLARAVNEVIQNPELAMQLKMNGLVSYEKGFTKAVFQKNAMEFYREVMRFKS